MKLTKLALWINTALLSFAALWILVIPALKLTRDVRDPALALGGVPKCVFAWHRHLTPQFAGWAHATMKRGLGAQVGQFDIEGTEWPAHSAMFYLLATEGLQKAWERNHALSLVAPNVYARDAIDSAAALLMDPVNATWVRHFWGDDKYLKSQDVFFRMMVINGLTAHLALTGDHKYADFLREQADSLANELDASQWGLLEDYPQQTYPVDIVPAIAGIQRIDRLLGTDHSKMIARAERLMEGRDNDPVVGLPGYFVDMHTAEALQPARGIGNSMTLVWTPQIWPVQSPEWYARHVKYFWQQDSLLAGFREFRRNSGYADWQLEVDAGPVIAGYGTSASAFGAAAAHANGDHLRGRLMEMEAIVGAWPLPNGAMPGARVLSTSDSPYIGETALLFALTRTPEDTAPDVMAKLTKPRPANSSLAPDPASTGTPGFVYLLIGGGLTLGVAILLAAVRRLMKPRREMSREGFVAWAVVMVAGAGFWFVSPFYAVLLWFIGQFWPRPVKRAKKKPALALAPAEA